MLGLDSEMDVQVEADVIFLGTGTSEGVPRYASEFCDFDSIVIFFVAALVV